MEVAADEPCCFKTPPALIEAMIARVCLMRAVWPGAPEDVLQKIWPYLLRVSAVMMRGAEEGRPWWAGRYLVENDCSFGAPVCRKGRMVLYRWRVCRDTRPRAAGARSRACETSAGVGEEEWRIASSDLLPKILRREPHAAALCLAGSLRTADSWLEITRELRETRTVVVNFE
eukprot:TRINITY_DN73570_c0_g1_i1.p1 TRINITY_DN73570_c0_g1~~TRINITY_DN73570_c0_g1_i1.p1  ORF type:complete len:189 (-),score=13.45 TRINITY_DN73570_c0_g1_i1:496-1014(-)